MPELESTLPDPSIPALQNDSGIKPRLLDQLRDCIRRRHYSLRTEKVYVAWVRRYVLFHDKRHPRDMGPDEVNAFLSHLARRDRVAASTQNQALSALLFLYRHVLDAPLPWLDDLERAKRPARLPTVLTVAEVQAIACSDDWHTASHDRAALWGRATPAGVLELARQGRQF